MTKYPILAIFVWFAIIFLLLRVMYTRDTVKANSLINNFFIRTFIIFMVAFATLWYIANFPYVFSVAMAFNFTFFYTAWNYLSALELSERLYQEAYDEARAAQIRRNQPPIWKVFMDATREWHPDASGPLWLPVPAAAS